MDTNPIHRECIPWIGRPWSCRGRWWDHGNDQTLPGAGPVVVSWPASGFRPRGGRYGGDPAGWLRPEVLPYLRAFSEMIPVLQARESMTRAMEIAVGNGTMKKAQSRRVMQDWRRTANRRGRRQVQKPKSREEHEAMLAAMGIGVQSV